VGRTVVDTGAGSLAGDALRSDEPVLITDLRTDSHSGVPPLLREHGVISGLSVVIRSSDQPYGVLAAYAARPRAFSATDGTFLRAVANVLAAAIARERAEAARREARLHALIEHAADMVSIVDPDSTIRYVSPAIEAALGYAPAELIGTQRGLMVHLEDAARGHAAFAAALTEPGPRPPVELRVQHKDGSWRWIEVRFTNLLADPAVAGIVINSRDVTERKRVETQLQHLAVHDALTDLPNRSLFLDRLGHALTTADRHHTAVAVLLLDLDRFKAVNDQLGHIAGDRLLVTVGQRLAAGLRPGDTLARLGGDEFAVLIEDLIDPADAGRRAAQLLGVLGEPVLIDGQEREVVVGASIGCALSAPGQVTPEALLHDADVALYRAKAAGTGQWVVFEPGMNHRATERLAVEGELRRALAGDELVLHYQPKVHLASGRLVGVEGLVRWRHPTRGLLPAAEFVGLAEETGLIVPLGRWVRTEVCRQARAWWDGDPQLADLTVCVNLAVRELRPEVVAEIAHLLVETRLPPTALMLEITERGMVAETEALRTMRALQQLGVGLAIDDFGTGYSGLSYLRHLPVDAIKIDQSFVTGVGQDPRNAAVLEAVTTLGHALGLEVVAEGIETAADLAVVKGSGIEVGQGYYFARPLPAEDLVTWVSDGAGRPG
jgi:diguanylate cyclase (GGDEF)-like protein/PAS domain S-box-containing protein